MKSKKQDKSVKATKLDLDAEVVADLEANDSDTEAIQGGRSSSGGSKAASGVGPASTGI